MSCRRPHRTIQSLRPQQVQAQIRNFGLRTALVAIFLGAAAAQATAQQATIDGVVDRTWTVARGVPPTATYSLITASGTRYQLRLAGRAPNGFGDRSRRWRVSGVVAASLLAPGTSGTPQITVSGATPLSGAALTGPVTQGRFITVMCHIPGQIGTGLESPATGKSDLAAWQGSSFPGMGDWFNKFSGGIFSYTSTPVLADTAAGTSVSEFFPRGTGPTVLPDLALIFDRCMPPLNLDLANFEGANIVYDVSQGGVAYGGFVTVVANGQFKTFLVSFQGPTSLESVLIDVVGLAYGWRASGPGKAGAGSPWDVISDPFVNTATCDCAPWNGHYSSVFSIAWNRNLMGWIAPSRQTTIPLGTEQIVTLTAPSFEGTPSAGSLDFLTMTTATGTGISMESRQTSTGPYDHFLPYGTVLLHTLDSTAHLLGTATIPQPNQVVPIAAQPGPVFDDTTDGMRVEVLSATPDGYRVRATNGWRVATTVQGLGAVNGLPTGVCSSSCTTILTVRGQTLSLTPRQAPGDDAFQGWRGACRGLGACLILQGGSKTDTAVFGPQISVIADANRPYGITARIYHDFLDAMGPGGVTWQLASGALPDGLTLDAVAGTLNGVPLTAGLFQYTIKLMSPNGTSKLQSFSTRIVAPLSITADANPYLINGRASKITLVAHGGGGAIVWTLTSGTLPAGVSFANGIFSGTPQAGGNTNVTVSAQWDTLVATLALPIKVISAPIVASGPILAAATIGEPYYTTLAAAQSAGPIRWSIVSGALPKGIALDSSGILVGTAEIPGNASFTLKAQSDTLSATASLSLAVSAPDVDPGSLLTALLHQGSVSGVQLHYLDFIGNRNGQLDVGDVRAWLIEQKVVTGASSFSDIIRAIKARIAGKVP